MQLILSYCFKSTKVVILMQANMIHLASYSNPYLLTQEKKFCELFEKQIVNLEISIGDVIFSSESILYSSLMSIDLYPRDGKQLTDIGSSTIAKFHLTLTTELLDQHGQIDTLVVRHYDRLSCFEKGVIRYDESSLTFDFGRQDCQFDPGETTFQVDLFRYGQANSIYSQDLGVQDFPGLQFQKITLDCNMHQVCQDLIDLIDNQSAIFGYYQFSTIYPITKHYQHFDNTGVTQETEAQMHFSMVNMVEIKFARVRRDELPHGTVVVLKDCLVVDLPGQDEVTGMLEVVFKGQRTSIDFVSRFAGEVLDIDCGEEGCLRRLRNQFTHFGWIEAYAYLRVGDDQKVLVSLTQVYPCFIKAYVHVLGQEICAVFESDGDCEFFYGYVEVDIVVDELPDQVFSGKFNFGHRNTNYCYRVSAEMKNHIRNTDVVTGFVLVNSIQYHFQGIDILMEKGHLVYGWVVVGIAIPVLTVLTLHLDRQMVRRRRDCVV